jgi:hypothetical protein
MKTRTPSRLKGEMTPTTSVVPVHNRLLQRECACGGTPGPTGECEGCRRKRLQRKMQNSETSTQPSTFNSNSFEVPPLVHEVLRSPGKPLDAATRAFMEPRFRHDFSRVRVHADARAAESARAVNALAYTVGRDIVFGTGQYAPRITEGKRLLAHEMTHVIQQSGLSLGQNLALARPDNHAEREAEEVTKEVIQSSDSTAVPRVVRSMVSRDAKPAVHRWKVAGNTATSDDASDTLGRLAQKAGAHFNDWKCIKPVNMRSSTLAKPPGNFDDRYELYVQIGDQFDISNLTAKTGPTVRIYLFDDGKEAAHANLAKLFYPGSASSLDADTDFDRASNSGTTPIADVLIFGHAGGDSMWGGASTFTPKDFDPEEPAQSFTLAHVGLFPRRCWFTRNATARSVGCDSETWGQDFATHYLRVGASATTTTKSVRPKCSAPLFIGGVCRSYDGLDFAASPAIGAAMLDGPFWTAAAFHSGKFWKTIKGKL